MADSTIDITIAGKSFVVPGGDQAKQELYRLAERRVNEKLADYQSQIKDVSIEDLMLFVAFDYEIEMIQSRRQNFVGSEERERLLQVGQRLDDYLNDLSREK